MDIYLNLDEIAAAVISYLETKYGHNISYDNVVLHYDPRKTNNHFSCEVRGFEINASGKSQKQENNKPSLSGEEIIDSKNDKIDLDYSKDIDIS